MISILGSRYNDEQKHLLSHALEEALYYVCNQSPANSRGCQACPSRYSRICKDLRVAADHLHPKYTPVENSVETVNK